MPPRDRVSDRGGALQEGGLRGGAAPGGGGGRWKPGGGGWLPPVHSVKFPEPTIRGATHVGAVSTSGTVWNGHSAWIRGVRAALMGPRAAQSKPVPAQAQKMRHLS